MDNYRATDRYRVVVLIKSQTDPASWIENAIKENLQDPQTGHKDELISIDSSVLR